MNNRLFKNTVLILYPAGGYGSFLHWALEYFSGNLPEGDRPFTKTGSAHKFFGLRLNTLGGIAPTADDYLSSDQEFQFGRTHGIFANDPDRVKHKSFVNTYSPFFKKIIHLTQSSDCHLMMRHNVITKIRDKSYLKFFSRVTEHYATQFNATPPISTWQLREMLSFDHESQMHHTTEYFQPVNNNSNVINVGITDLVNNFESTLKNLFVEINIPMVRESELAQVKDEWLGLQKFTKIDKLCRDIVDAVISGQHMVWDSNQLTVLDEAYIQYLLRNNRLEIRCDGLDTFPTNSVQLKELLYPV